MWGIFLRICFLTLVAALGACAHSQTAKQAKPSVATLFGMSVRTLTPEDIAESNALFAYIKGDLLVTEGHAPQSIPELDRAILQSPNSAYLYLSRGTAYAILQKIPEAQADCLKALELAPNLLDAKLLLSRVLSAQGEFAQAVPLLETVMRKSPENKETYPLLAVAYINLHQYGKVIPLMKRLLVQDPDALVAYYYMGAVYGTYLKQSGLALQMYRKILDHDPRNVSVYNAITQLFVDNNDIPHAIETLQQAFATGVDDVTLKLRLSSLYYQQKKYTKAATILENVLQKTPNSNKVRYYLGVIYEEANDFNKARDQYNLITADSTYFKDAMLRQALYYYRSAQYGSAIGVLQMAIMRSPKLEEFYPLLALMQEETNNLSGARTTLERGLKALPKSLQLIYSLAIVNDKLKNTDAAIKLMKHVLELEPGNISAMNYIGYTYVERGIHLDEAELLLLRAAEMQPQDGYVLDSLGWLYFRKNEYGKALALLEQAAQITPNEPVVHQHLAELYAAMGRKRDAIAEYRQAIALMGLKPSDEANVTKMQEALNALEAQ